MKLAKCDISSSTKPSCVSTMSGVNQTLHTATEAVKLHEPRHKKTNNTVFEQV